MNSHLLLWLGFGVFIGGTLGLWALFGNEVFAAYARGMIMMCM